MRRPKWANPTEVRRWLVLRCEHCGHRFRWKRDARNSFGNRDGKVYHGPCMGDITWRTAARDHLSVLSLATELAGLTERDVTVAAEMCAGAENDRIAASNRVWRSFYAMRTSASIVGRYPDE